MNTPSIKTLTERLGIAPKAARVLKGYMDTACSHGSLALYTHAVGHGKNVDRVMDYANVAMGGCGVESIRDGEWTHYYGDTGLLYVNLGETYTTTLCYDTRSGRFSVTSWGDIVERNEKRFADK